MLPTSQHYEPTKALLHQAHRRALARQMARAREPQIKRGKDGQIQLIACAPFVDDRGVPTYITPSSALDEHLARLRAWKKQHEPHQSRDWIRRVLRFIHQFVDEHGHGPRLCDLQYGLNLSRMQAQYRRNLLIERGVIESRGDRRNRRYYPAVA